MCKCISGIAVNIGDGVKMYTHTDTDSHTEIRRFHHICDDSSAAASRQTPVELIPVRGLGLLDIGEMGFVLDAEKPRWWTEEMQEEATRQLHSAWLKRWKGKRLIFKGYLDLRSLTSIPEGVTLSAGGYLDLESLTSIPEGVTLSAGGDLYLGSLTSIPEGVTLSAGGYLDLGSLTSIPEGVTLSAGGYLDLRSLTSIPEGVTLSAGGDLYLRSLTSIPEGVTLSAGGYLYLGSLTSIPEGVRNGQSLRIGRYQRNF